MFSAKARFADRKNVLTIEILSRIEKEMTKWHTKKTNKSQIICTRRRRGLRKRWRSLTPSRHRRRPYPSILHLPRMLRKMLRMRQPVHMATEEFCVFARPSNLTQKSTLITSSPPEMFLFVPFHFSSFSWRGSPSGGCGASWLMAAASSRTRNRPR